MRASPRRSRPRGMALVLVLVAVSVATILGLGFALAQSTAAPLARNIGSGCRARAIAESGLEMAVAYVLANDDWRTQQSSGLWVQDQPFDGGTFTIYGEDGQDIDGDGVVDGDGDLSDSDSDLLTLTCVGTHQGARSTVRAVVLPVKRVLMIVDRPDHLRAQDTARISLLEGWGWTVRLLRARAGWSELNNALEGVNVIYFPAHTPVRLPLSILLRHVDVPIVLESRRLVRRLRITNRDSRDFRDDSVDVLQLTQTRQDEFGNPVVETVTHYITEPFSIGPLRICDNSDRLVRLYGRIGSGVQALATRVNHPSQITLAVMEKGAMDVYRNPTRSRRVVLPWGKESFSIGSLNAEGRLLLRRALDWSGEGWNGLLPGLAVWDRIELRGMSCVDGYDSGFGPYSDDNANQNATIATNSSRDDRIRLIGGILNGSAYVPPGAEISKVIDIRNGGGITGGSFHLPLPVPIPTIEQPDLGPSSGNKTFSSGNTVIDGDRHYRRLTLTGNAVVTITGDVVILCDSRVRIRGNARLVLAPGASLTMYTKDDVDIEDNARVNMDSPDPTRLQWLMISDDMQIRDDAQVCATIKGYYGEVYVSGSADVYGTFLGKRAMLRHSAAWHVDTANSGTVVTLGGGVDLSTITGKRVRWIYQP